MKTKSFPWGSISKLNKLSGRLDITEIFLVVFYHQRVQIVFIGPVPPDLFLHDDLMMDSAGLSICLLCAQKVKFWHVTEPLLVSCSLFTLPGVLHWVTWKQFYRQTIKLTIALKAHLNLQFKDIKSQYRKSRQLRWWLSSVTFIDTLDGHQTPSLTGACLSPQFYAQFSIIYSASGTFPNIELFWVFLLYTTRQSSCHKRFLQIHEFWKVTYRTRRK